MSLLEELLAAQIETSSLPKPVREHRFDGERRWRLDFAWPELHVGVEIQGGVWAGGRHTRPWGYKNDLEKHNAAVEQGWSVLYYDSDWVERGLALAQIERLFAARQKGGTDEDKSDRCAARAPGREAK